MEALEQELEARRDEIFESVELLFKANMKITDWDVPEVNDKKAAKKLHNIMQEAMDKLKTDIDEGAYDYY